MGITRVLIIDDEVDICLLVGHTLKKRGIPSNMVHTIQDGMDTFKENSYDLVFLDINLPDGNGLDILPVLLELNSNCKVVVISAYDTSIEKTKASNAGAYSFIGKPFSKKNILTVLDTLKN